MRKLKRYTLYNSQIAVPVIVDGTAKECANIMGIRESSFYGAVLRRKTGKNKRWYILCEGEELEKDVLRQPKHKDYAVSALGIEAERRHTSYGKLVAMTTIEERKDIANEYLRRH